MSTVYLVFIYVNTFINDGKVGVAVLLHVLLYKKSKTSFFVCCTILSVTIF